MPEYVIQTPAAGYWNHEKEISFAQDKENNLKLLREIAIKNVQSKRTNNNVAASRNNLGGTMSYVESQPQKDRSRNYILTTSNMTHNSNSKIIGNSGVAGGSFSHVTRPRTSVAQHQNHNKTYLLGGGQSTNKYTLKSIVGKDLASTNASQNFTHSQTTKQIQFEMRNDNISNMLEQTFWKATNFSFAPNKGIYSAQWRPDIAQYTHEEIKPTDKIKSRNVMVQKA